MFNMLLSFILDTEVFVLFIVLSVKETRPLGQTEK